MRLDETARLAKAEGAGAFSTTLFASRQQNHELIREAGETAGKKHGINFLSADFRDALPPERLTRGLYKQQYCGCIFSEQERFENTGKELYQGCCQAEIIQAQYKTRITLY